jgi:hypothetical protein
MEQSWKLSPEKSFAPASGSPGIQPSLLGPSLVKQQGTQRQGANTQSLSFSKPPVLPVSTGKSAGWGMGEDLSGGHLSALLGLGKLERGPDRGGQEFCPHLASIDLGVAWSLLCLPGQRRDI